MKLLKRLSSLLNSTKLIFLVFIITSSISKGQNKRGILKLSPVLEQQIYSAKGDGKRIFRIMVTGKELPVSLAQPKYNSSNIIAYDQVSFYLLSATTNELLDSILTLPGVLFADEGTRIPKEEVQVNTLDLSTNKINVVHQRFPQWNGDGLTFSLKENKPDTTDIDFSGRYFTTSLSSSVVSSHATNMATMITGAGNSWYTGKGAAWGSLISSSSFDNLLPDPTAILQLNKITVQNHSYGVGIENFYGADAAIYDASLISNPTLLNIFSAGNSGTLRSPTGIYAGITNFANLTGSFKMAKNIITAGATDSFGNIAVQSSKGPAHDGRVKPDLVAFGIDGSSGAAALVSGVSLMLQQQYKQINGSLPANALIKAILINSADDRGNKEVDYSNGFGSLNALNAVSIIQVGRYLNGVVSNGGVQNFSISIPPGIKKVKITLVWNDPPAQANAAKALVNDLDMVLLQIATNEIWQPWVLNHFPHIDSLKLPAIRKRDSLNNVEQITLDNPVAGRYQVLVKGYSVSPGSQSFYIAYQFDSTDIFEWHFPTAADPVFSNAVNTLRWNASYTAATGKLDYSVDHGSTWQEIDPAVNLANGYYHWNTPSNATAALLKMTIGSHQIIGVTFVISPVTQMRVGFNCPDSLLLYWNNLTKADGYRLYKLGNRYMEPVSLTKDSFAVLQKNSNTSLFYAVAPLISGREGAKSFTINYRLQGVDCYIKSFLAGLVNGTATLSLSLGSLYQVNKIVLEKIDGSAFRPLQQLLNNSNLSVSFTDNKLARGLNIYRIKIDLVGGGIVYSLSENVFYFGESGFIIYPNPALQHGEINLAQANVDVSYMQVFNVAGVMVFEKDLDDRINKIPAGKLSKGVYFVRITNAGKLVETLRLVVY